MSGSTFSASIFGTEGSSITHGQLNNQDTAQQIILDRNYTGGWTNTQEGILQCVDNLDGHSSTNTKVIVVITDGVPTACRNGTSTPCAAGNQCECVDSEGSTGNYNPFRAAQEAATAAAQKDYLVVPVGILSGSLDEDKLNKLARCPSEQNADKPCEKYKGLDVANINELFDIFENVVVTAGCG